MSHPVAQNDPHELLEVFDANGQPTGVARSRAEIHRRGDWHQAFHCWIVRDGPRGEELVLQRRSLAKDTFPGSWDAAAAGHWRFGETPPEAAREVEEELGLVVPFAALRWVGREVVDREHPNGLIDREHHEVYLLRWPAPLTSYRPDPGEVAMLGAFPRAELVGVAAGELDSVEATEAVTVDPDGSLRVVAASLTAPLLVPYSPDRLRRVR
ncbi:MAG: NUDIX domain-containing protein [Chloroflexi bacterium]|nr:NUDIX domain-containing protein [Chloroflexota bacterium]